MNQFFLQHPYFASALATWLASSFATAIVGLFPAPTKDSSRRYVLFFKFVNGFVGNVARARSTSVESSPNFHDAVDRVLTDRGLLHP